VGDGELEEIGSDDIDELLLLPKARLRAPKSSSSPKRPSFAFLSKRSYDLDAFRVFCKSGEPIRRGGIGGELFAGMVKREIR